MKVEKGKYSCSYFKLWSGKMFATPGKYDEESGEFTSTGDMFRCYNINDSDYYRLDDGVEYDDFETLCHELVNDILPYVSNSEQVRHVTIKESGLVSGDYIISWVTDTNDDGVDYLYDMVVTLRYILSYKLKNSNDFIDACNNIIKK